MAGQFHIVYLSLGSNLEVPLNQLKTARKLIQEKLGPILAESGIYKTAAWGLEDQPDFLNQVLKIETALEAEELLARILSIEAEMGRVRSIPNAPRKIDIDILFYDDIRLNKNHLAIPHPFIEKRRFVLVPLAEIAPDLIHPASGKNITELLTICPDKLNVSKM